MKPTLESFQKSINQYRSRLVFIYTNMRLLLLVMFTILAGYLVLRVNTLVNQEPVVDTADPTATSGLTAQPDREVLSVFNELQTQDVSVSSQFEDNRQNPF